MFITDGSNLTLVIHSLNFFQFLKEFFQFVKKYNKLVSQLTFSPTL